MKSKYLIYTVLVILMFSIQGAQKVQAETNSVQSCTVSATSDLAVGDTFTVSNITYRVSSATGSLEVQAISAALKLTTISIPESVTYNDVSYAVTSIPNGSFYGNGRATKIVISEGVKTVGTSAFQGCDAVTEIVLPATLETFTTMGFKKLETITLASENPHFQLKDGVLFTKNGTKLWLYPSGKTGTSYTVPAGTVTIGEAAFYQNQHLQTISISSSVSTIEDYAFCQLNSLTSLTLGNSVSSVGKHNLRECPKLKSVVLKNSGTIGAYSIYGCPSLEEITIEGNMSGYKEYVFYNLPSLKSYDVVSSPYYSDKDGVLYNKGELLRYPSSKTDTQYIVPEGTTKIAGLAFNYMQHTKEIILTPGVYVELMAFHYPNTNSPVTIYFRDQETVSLSKSSSGVFVGLNSGSKIHLPSDAALTSFNSYGSAVNPKSAVTVSKKTIPATAIKLNETSVEMEKGESFTLTGTLTPYYSTEIIKWSSSDSDIATVSANGIITAVKKGTCKITAATDSGISKSCTVTVIKEEVIESTESNKEPDKITSDTSGSSSSDDKNTSSSEAETKKETEKDSSSKSEKNETKTEGFLNKITSLFTGKESKADSKKDTEQESKSEDTEKKESVFDKFVNIFTDKDETEKSSTSDDNEDKQDATESEQTEEIAVKQHRKWPLVIVLVTIVMFCAICFFAWRNQRRKRELTTETSRN